MKSMSYFTLVLTIIVLLILPQGVYAKRKRSLEEKIQQAKIPDKEMIVEAISKDDLTFIKNYFESDPRPLDYNQFFALFPKMASPKMYDLFFQYITDNKEIFKKLTFDPLLKRLNSSNYNSYKRHLINHDQFQKIIGEYSFMYCSYFHRIRKKEILRSVETLFYIDIVCSRGLTDELVQLIHDKEFTLANLVATDNIQTFKVDYRNKVIKEAISTYSLLTDEEKSKAEIQEFYLNLNYRVNRDVETPYNPEDFSKFKNIIVIIKSQLKIPPPLKTPPSLEKLNQIEAQLLREFVGWEEPIRKIISIIKGKIFHPEPTDRPTIIPLIGLHGCGKTQLIERLSSLLGREDHFLHYPLQKETPFLPYDKIKKITEEDQLNGHQELLFVQYDDIQNLAPYNALSQLEIKKRLKADSFFDTILSRGEKRISRSRSFAFYIQELTGTAKIIENLNHQIRFHYNKIKILRSRKKKLEEEIKSDTEMIKSIEKQIDEHLIKIVSLMSKHNDHIKIKTNRISNLIKWSSLLPLKNYLCRYYFGDDIKCNNLMAKISDDIQAIKTLKDQINKISNKNNMFKVISDISYSKYDEKQEINTIKVTLNEVRNDPLFTNFVHDNLELFKNKSLSSNIRHFQDDFISHPIETIEQLNLRASNHLLRKTIKYNNLIIFITGVPEHLTTQLHQFFNNQRENDIDPHFFSEKANEIISQEKISEWFIQLLGEDNVSLQTSFRLNRWSLYPPLNSDQWIELIDKRLSFHEEEFQRAAQKLNFHSQIKFDYSVKLLLYREGVAPLEGPRVLFDADMEIFKSFIDPLAHNIKTNYPDKDITYTISYKLSQNRHFLVAENKPFKIHIEIPIGVTHQFKYPSLEEGSATRERNALHIAGFAVVGALLFRSLPTQIENKELESIEETYSFWKAPKLPHYEHTKNLILSYLGAYACECEFMRPQFRTKMATLFYPLLLKLLIELKEDLDNTRQNMSLEKKGESVPLSEILPSSLSHDPFFTAVDQKEYPQIIDNYLKEVRKIVLKNKQLISAIANELKGKDKIDFNTIHSLFKRNLKIKREKTLKTKIIEFLIGKKVESNSIIPPYLNELLTNQPGTISSDQLDVLDIKYKKIKQYFNVNINQDQNFLNLVGEFIDQIHAL